MKLSKANKRDKKHDKKVKGMQVSNRSILLLEEIKYKKAQAIRAERESKEESKNA